MANKYTIIKAIATFMAAVAIEVYMSTKCPVEDINGDFVHVCGEDNPLPSLVARRWLNNLLEWFDEMGVALRLFLAPTVWRWFLLIRDSIVLPGYATFEFFRGFMPNWKVFAGLAALAVWRWFLFIRDSTVLPGMKPRRNSNVA